MDTSLLTDELVISVTRMFRFTLEELVAKSLWDNGVRRMDIVKLGLMSDYPFSNIYNYLDNWERGIATPKKVPSFIQLDD